METASPLIGDVLKAMLVETKDVILDNFETHADLVEIHFDRRTVLVHFVSDEDERLIEITFTAYEPNKTKSGAHMIGVDDFEFRLVRTLESCLKDGFERIWIHYMEEANETAS